jgi:hypothetical protein
MTEDASHRLTRVTPFVGGRDKTDSDPVHPIHVVCKFEPRVCRLLKRLFLNGSLVGWRGAYRPLPSYDICPLGFPFRAGLPQPACHIGKTKPLCSFARAPVATGRAHGKHAM